MLVCKETALFHSTMLDNGIRVVMEKTPGVRTIAVGIWFQKGSRHEPESLAGITHFMEHMLFKGSNGCGKLALARWMDSLGGQFDAATSKEFMVVSARFLDEYLADGMALLNEIVFAPCFPSDELHREKHVVLEEIALYRDDPEEQVHERLVELSWNGHPLSRTIVGEGDIIQSIDRRVLNEYYRSFVDPAGIIVSVAGNLQFEETLRHCRERFSTVSGSGGGTRTAPPVFRPGVSVHNQPLEQIYFCVGIPWLSIVHPNRYAGYVLNMILGGNMSSRLFQKLREEHGLTYNVASYESSFSDSGMLIVSGSTGRDTLNKSLELTLDCLMELAEGRLSFDELEHAKACLKNNVVMSFEGSYNRMGALARQYAYLGRRVSLDESLDKIAQVTVNDVENLCESLLGKMEFSLALAGPTGFDMQIDEPFSRDVLKSL